MQCVQNRFNFSDQMQNVRNTKEGIVKKRIISNGKQLFICSETNIVKFTTDPCLKCSIETRLNTWHFCTFHMFVYNNKSKGANNRHAYVSENTFEIVEEKKKNNCMCAKYH